MKPGKFTRAPVGGEKIVDMSETGAASVWQVKTVEGSGLKTEIVIAREGAEKRILLQDFKRRYQRI